VGGGDRAPFARPRGRAAPDGAHAECPR
jgi:hypothetical protein